MTSQPHSTARDPASRQHRRGFDITPASVGWEQALSADDGKTWEINGVMNLTAPAS